MLLSQCLPSTPNYRIATLAFVWWVRLSIVYDLVPLKVECIVWTSLLS